jgi:oligopeptide transport system substrate-binding protein
MKMSLLARCLLGSIVLVSASSCGKRETAVSVGNQKQILHWGNLGEPTDLDPQIISSVSDFNLVMTLFEGLTSYDPKDLHAVPGVAERWESTPDAATWTFHLRADAKWSNGDPVTAHDFIFAFERILTPTLGAEYANMLFLMKNAQAFYERKLKDFSEVGAKAPDDRTLVIALNGPVPYFPHLVSHSAWYPLHKPTLEKYGYVDRRGGAWTRAGNHVGNGPFVLAEWKPHQFIRVTKSPTYWDRAAVKLNEVYAYPIENETSEEAAFRSGQLHITAQVPIEKIADYKKSGTGFLRQSTYLSNYFYTFNTTKAPLNDARVRRALSMAIDREQIVEHVAKGGQAPAGNYTPPNTAGFTARAKLTTDIPGARKLLAEAGFPEGRGFPKLELLYNTTEGHRKIAEAVQQMWRKNLGIEVSLYNQEAKVWSDTLRQKNYQIARFGWSGDYLDPSTFLETLRTGDGNNHAGWSNAEYDHLLDQARGTADNAKRYEYFQRCEEILRDECPLAFIYFYSRNILMRPEVKGYYGNLLDLHTLKGVYLDSSSVASLP